jgi:hypothetical protein
MRGEEGGGESRPFLSLYDSLDVLGPKRDGCEGRMETG